MIIFQDVVKDIDLVNLDSYLSSQKILQKTKDLIFKEILEMRKDDLINKKNSKIEDDYDMLMYSQDEEDSQESQENDEEDFIEEDFN